MNNTQQTSGPDPLSTETVRSSTESPQPTTSQTGDQSSASASDNRHNGKVSRLPKATRDRINVWLRDGVTYPDIIQRLGDEGKGLNIGHIHEWKKRGYQDWLLEQAFLERTRIRQDSASDLGHDYDATEFNHAALQLGSLHIFEALRDLGPGTLDEKLGGDSAAFTRLLNCLARVSKETMLLQKYRDACAQARNILKNMRDPNRKLTESENRALVRKVDEILGLVSPDSPQTHDPDLRKSPGDGPAPTTPPSSQPLSPPSSQPLSPPSSQPLSPPSSPRLQTVTPSHPMGEGRGEGSPTNPPVHESINPPPTPPSSPPCPPSEAPRVGVSPPLSHGL